MLLACSCQRYLLRAVGGVVGERNVTGTSAGLCRSEGDLDGAIGASGNGATVNAGGHGEGLLDCGQREVAAGGDGGDVQRCISGVGEDDLFRSALRADEDLGPLKRSRREADYRSAAAARSRQCAD